MKRFDTFVGISLTDAETAHVQHLSLACQKYLATNLTAHEACRLIAYRRAVQAGLYTDTLVTG